MDSLERTFCSGCGKHVGKHHRKIVERGEIAGRPLCEQCYEAEILRIAEDEMAAVALASCNYCGKKALARVSSIDAIIGGPGDRFACESCYQEYHRFLLEYLDAMNAELLELDRATQIEAVRQIYDETEAHMQQWVRQRDN